MQDEPEGAADSAILARNNVNESDNEVSLMPLGSRLIRPSAETTKPLFAMAREFHAEEDSWLPTDSESFETFMKLVDWCESGHNLPADRVPQNIYLLSDGDDIVGCSRLRRRLNPALQIDGGHIGYQIRPSRRHRGYGHRILALTLEKARDLGLERALVTTATHNTYSIRIIEGAGGIADGENTSPRNGEEMRRYWVPIL